MQTRTWATAAALMASATMTNSHVAAMESSVPVSFVLSTPGSLSPGLLPTPVGSDSSVVSSAVTSAVSSAVSSTPVDSVPVVTYFPPGNGASSSAAATPTASSAASAGNSSSASPTSTAAVETTKAGSSVISSVPSLGFSTSVATPAVTSSTAAATSSAAPSKTSSAPAGGASDSPAKGKLTGPCANEGIFNCIDGKTYQQCASGSWSVVMGMPPSTQCALGQTANLWARGENTGFRARRRRGGY